MMTIVVENDIQSFKLFRNGSNGTTVLYPSLEGLMKFITVNHDSISTVVMDDAVDKFKIPILAEMISKVYPHIKTVKYSTEENDEKRFDHCIHKPLDHNGKLLLDHLSGGQ